MIMQLALSAWKPARALDDLSKDELEKAEARALTGCPTASERETLNNHGGSSSALPDKIGVAVMSSIESSGSLGRVK